jgi:hypothetical protein
MGRFRSILRRAVKPAAMAVVAGTLALSLTVTTTQKAEAAPVAALPVIAAAEAIVGGASIPLAMPSLLAASIALHPVGWAIGAAVVVGGLAYGAYATRDYWLPYVTGDFGKSKGGADRLATTGKTDQNIAITKVEKKTWYYNVTMVYSGGSTSWFQRTAAYHLRCAYGHAGGTQYSVKTGVSSNYGDSYSNTQTPQPSCDNTNDVALGLVVGAPGADPQIPGVGTSGPLSLAGPKNVMSDGTLLSQGSPAFDPRGSDVKYKTTSECISDDGIKTTISAEWLGSDGGAKFPSCAAAGEGHNTGKNKIEGYAPTAPGTVGTVPETIWETTAPAVDPNYAQCDQGRPGSGCKMAITIDGKPCVVGQWECENWTELWKDSNTKTRVGCTYGPYTLSPDACSIMEPAYRPGGAPMTEQNIDGNPSTRNNTDLGGQTFTPKQTAGAPGASGMVSPSADEKTKNCFPEGWAVFNPVEWVLKPMRCAFEPTEDPKQKIEAKVNTASTKAPFVWMGGAGTVVAAGVAMPTSSCPDWTVEIPGFSQNVVCESSFTQAIVSSRGLLFGAMVIAMFWPFIRSLWYSVIPVLRPAPTS